MELSGRFQAIRVVPVAQPLLPVPATVLAVPGCGSRNAPKVSPLGTQSTTQRSWAGGRPAVPTSRSV